MRIFTAVRHSSDPKFYYGGLWSGNFYPGLRKLGHEVIESQIDLLPASKFMHIADGFTAEEREVRARITERIIEELTRAHNEKPVDLFLSYFYNAHFDPAGFKEIARLGIPTINFYCNSIYQFDLVADIARCVDLSWHAERDARVLYREVNANPVWVQMGADPDVYHPVEELRRQSKACFVGQRYADRDRYLSELIRNAVPVDIYGHGWTGPTFANGPSEASSDTSDEYLGRKLTKPGTLRSYAQVAMGNFKGPGILSGARRTISQASYRKASASLEPSLAQAARGLAGNLSETLAQYEVVLNFSNVWADGRPASDLIAHVRLRDFEGPMCRACYLTGYSEEIEEFYELGAEIDVYRDAAELIEKARFYLSHPTQAEKLRQAGYRRAVRDHTWERRFEQLFKQTKPFRRDQ
jgi:spore maturation protein CgeB